MIAELRDGSHSPKAKNHHWKFMSKASRGRYKLKQSKGKKILMDSGILHVLSLSLSRYWIHPFIFHQNSSQINQSWHCLVKTAQWRLLFIFQMGKFSRNYFCKVTDWITQPRLARAFPTSQLAPRSPHKASLFPPSELFDLFPFCFFSQEK